MDGKLVPSASNSKPRTPWGSILSFVTAIVYGVSPIDLLPDLIPLLGWLDDALIVPLLLLYAWSLWRRHKSARAKVAPAN